jgi:hypothetical protein
MATRNRSTHIEKKERPSYRPLAPAVEQASKVLFCLGENPVTNPLTSLPFHETGGP